MHAVGRLVEAHHGCVVRVASQHLVTGRLDRGVVCRAMYVELDTTAKLGRTTVVWVVDLPSDWRISRRAIAANAAAAIAAWSGQETIHHGHKSKDIRDAGPGFPAPDLVLGDFNIPRGSDSLRLLVGNIDYFQIPAGGCLANRNPRAFATSPVFARLL